VCASNNVLHSTCPVGVNVYSTWPYWICYVRKIYYSNNATQFKMQKQKVSSNQVRIQIIGLLGLCQTGYNVTSVPTQYTQSFAVKPVCQIMYENQMHSARPPINTVLNTAHCASAKPHSSLTRLKILLQPSHASGRLPTCCWLWQITACPFYPIKWKEDKMGRERDSLLRNN